MTAPLFLGVDIGTQGARVVLINVTGLVIAESEESFPLTNGSLEEQSPEAWWQSCLRSLQKLITTARTVVDVRYIKAIAVTATSGTVIPLDVHNEPLHPAIMYSDKRSAAEGAFCREVALRFNSTGYTGFNSSSGLSKMVWFVNKFPGKAEKINKWVHAGDFITGKLSGKWDITDYTNALKSGYDLQQKKWPEYLYKELPLKKDWLPQVVPSGTPVATLSPVLALSLGLEAGIPVVAGMTDGCASQIASGAVHPGDWNTTIGTTLVIKGVTRKEIRDPEERLYNHRHPEGYWMPGGAGNIGADWVTTDFKEDLNGLNDAARQLIPTGKLAYPLKGTGERFPFIAPRATGFEPLGSTRPELFAANMEGVAYIERYAYQMIQKLGGESVKAVFTAGGASNSAVWLSIRSSVLNLPLYKMKQVTGAFGAAILAASKTHFTSVIEAAEALAQIETTIQPQPEWVEKYSKSYGEFIGLLEEKGYIIKEAYA